VSRIDPGDELMDVVDDHDRVVGQATRREVRRRRLLHRFSSVLCWDGMGRVYVHRRTDDKDVYPGMYDMTAGGVLAAGETYLEAARRELAEELGVEGGTLTFLASFYTTPGWSDEVLDLYLAEGVKPIEGEVPHADWEEQGMEVVRLPFEEALRRATGPPGDAKTLVALGLYGLKLAGTWTPDPADRPPPDAPARRAAARPA